VCHRPRAGPATKTTLNFGTHYKKMKSTTIGGLTGLMILILGLIYCSPIEPVYQPEHRIITLIISAIVILIFYTSIRILYKEKNMFIRLIGLITLGLLGLAYFWIGVWSVPQAALSDKYPMWVDIEIYENKNNDKIIGQFMEISGSLHDYRNRKIIHEFNNGIRLSYTYPDNKINGIWKVHRLHFDNGLVKKKDTTFSANYINGRIEK
jgi:hypothetical protein